MSRRLRLRSADVAHERDLPFSATATATVMRERAELIGGQFEVWSQADMGTEVALTIPGAAIYATPRVRREFWSFVVRKHADS